MDPSPDQQHSHDGLVLAVTPTHMILAHVSCIRDSNDVITELDSLATLEAINATTKALSINFETGVISLASLPVSFKDEEAKCFGIPGLVGVLNLGAAELTEGIPHLTVVTRRRGVGRLGRVDPSNVFVVEQVAVLPCKSHPDTLTALSDALALRNAISTTAMSPLDSAVLQTRLQSVATMKAGVDLGVSSVKAGVGLGVSVVSSSVGLVSSVGSATLNVLRSRQPSQVPSVGDESEGCTDEGGVVDSGKEPSPSVSPQPKRQTIAATATKMVSSLNPFKSNTLQITNAESSPELETLTEPIPTSVSKSPTASPQIKSTSNHTLLGSLRNLATGGQQPTPVKSDSVHPSDLKALLELQTFFYCDGAWDLTRRAEQQHAGGSLEDTDDRFFWNKHTLQPLMDINAPRAFLTPMIQGFVEVKDKLSIAGGDEGGETEKKEFDFAVISRRNKYRAGFRYERRGADARGDVANFVETEMIVFGTVDEKHHVASFLQIRGSIPLYWAQTASTKTLNPTPSLDKTDEENVAVLTLHMQELEKLYNAVVIVDLVGKEGREEPLGTRFKNCLKHIEAEHPLIKYIDYDFHHETKGLNYANLHNLIDILKKDFEKLKHFWSINGENMSHQTGIIRTNCMDCLDRTNVVQSILARHMLNQILLRTGIQRQLPDSPTESTPPVADAKKQKEATGTTDFESTFKNVWANNGDSLSTAYTGTGALKGDFTRTGVRNVKGMLNDAANSVSRLYADNFQNKVRQAAVDLFLGL
ncbi:Phosphatidylinositide phosphatase SAC2 [Podochytrium sp. JEL0797]|nr:Phosphatidylinositide phosphatase SAC2 [Podochytrium sp. JEL0797]